MRIPFMKNTSTDEPRQSAAANTRQSVPTSAQQTRRTRSAHDSGYDYADKGEFPEEFDDATHARRAPRESGERRSGLGAHGTRDSRHARGGGAKPRKKSFLMRYIEEWCDRLLGIMNDRSFANQSEMYAAHRTSRDYICTTLGVAAWGMVFPVLTVVATQLVGAEQAGMFSMAFIVGQLLMILANYGVRTYQVSDIEEAHSFSDYQANRFITCFIMVVVGVLYCTVRGYGEEMFTISMGIYVYKMIDGLADVYEGRLQQVDKMYLAGISQAFRSVIVLIVFSAALLFTRNLAVASVACAIAAALTFIVLTFPLAHMEAPGSAKLRLGSVLALLKQCFPLFVALFLYALIDAMPKFVMEGVLSYDNQLYFNALYFPAQGILLTVGLIYKPLLVRMTMFWADPEKRRRFDMIIFVILGVVIALTAVMALVMNTIGIPIMSFMYGLDFEQFRGLCLIMLVAGGVTAAIDFLYQTITVLRRQKTVMKLYLITFGFSLFVPVLLVNFTGLPGAVIGYLIVMCILFVLLVWEYLRIRFSFNRDGEAEVANAEAAAANSASASSSIGLVAATKKPRPSEIRAERKRREEVMRRRTHQPPKQ